MVTLPLVQSQDQSLMLLQTRWKSVLDPALLSQILNGNLLTGLSLTTGDNAIDHKLGRTPLGWIIVNRDASTAIYQSDAGPLRLILNSSGSVNVSLWVF